MKKKKKKIFIGSIAAFKTWISYWWLELNPSPSLMKLWLFFSSNQVQSQNTFTLPDSRIVLHETHETETSCDSSPPAKIKKQTLKCCVEGCGSETGCGVTLHQFPQEKTDEWKQEITNKNNQKLSVNSNTRLCRLHFKSGDYLGQNLKQSAIPSIFPLWVNAHLID